MWPCNEFGFGGHCCLCEVGLFAFLEQVQEEVALYLLLAHDVGILAFYRGYVAYAGAGYGELAFEVLQGYLGGSFFVAYGGDYVLVHVCHLLVELFEGGVLGRCCSLYAFAVEQECVVFGDKGGEAGVFDTQVGD
ncbi:hypothetical protein SDC9_120528 [bioreactor metagenome]|uniref:Uncharacterized protein n=1 Tax=bioreactor metagenome TaxID=1076179 RepID=A0A645C6X7_9ZZZZ